MCQLKIIVDERNCHLIPSFVREAVVYWLKRCSESVVAHAYNPGFPGGRDQED
jgi:hypothetical protein